MNLSVAIRHRYPICCSVSSRWLGWLGIICLLLPVLNMALPSTGVRASTEADIQPLVHFRDASHDWLLVVDPATREVVVYDASSGRPVQRLGADIGLAGVNSIARQGSHLRVTSDQRPAIHVLSLPDLQPVALNER